ncbi:MAG TPA: serine protease [Rhizomicrobium sp.]|nr:serine protease [Rhizomicrobium sp.]
MERMKKSIFTILAAALLAGCATSSGVPAARIAEAEIAAAYLPLHGRVHLGIDTADGAAMVIAPGIAVTNAHNRRFIDGPVIGEAAQSDLLFFRVVRSANPVTAMPTVGAPVIAYGQGADAELRRANGVIRAIETAPGHDIARWFTFEANAGPGFSGGPVVDAQGRLVGITFAYKDEGGKRLMYAYDMARVRAELQAVQSGAR